MNVWVPAGYAELAGRAILKSGGSGMKALAVIALSVLLLGLAWLALDDITTGREPSFALEWAAVGVCAVWFLVLAAVGLRRAHNGAGRVER